jgi:hypothetical protein
LKRRRRSSETFSGSTARNSLKPLSLSEGPADASKQQVESKGSKSQIAASCNRSADNTLKTMTKSLKQEVVSPPATPLDSKLSDVKNIDSGAKEIKKKGTNASQSNEGISAADELIRDTQVDKKHRGDSAASSSSPSRWQPAGCNVSSGSTPKVSKKKQKKKRERSSSSDGSHRDDSSGRDSDDDSRGLERSKSGGEKAKLNREPESDAPSESNSEAASSDDDTAATKKIEKKGKKEALSQKDQKKEAKKAKKLEKKATKKARRKQKKQAKFKEEMKKAGYEETYIDNVLQNQGGAKDSHSSKETELVDFIQITADKIAEHKKAERARIKKEKEEEEDIRFKKEKEARARERQERFQKHKKEDKQKQKEDEERRRKRAERFGSAHSSLKDITQGVNESNPKMNAEPKFGSFKTDDDSLQKMKAMLMQKMKPNAVAQKPELATTNDKADPASWPGARTVTLKPATPFDKNQDASSADSPSTMRADEITKPRKSKIELRPRVNMKPSRVKADPYSPTLNTGAAQSNSKKTKFTLNPAPQVKSRLASHGSPAARVKSFPSSRVLVLKPTPGAPLLRDRKKSSPSPRKFKSEKKPNRSLSSRTSRIESSGKRSRSRARRSSSRPRGRECLRGRDRISRSRSRDMPRSRNRNSLTSSSDRTRERDRKRSKSRDRKASIRRDTRSRDRKRSRSRDGREKDRSRGARDGVLTSIEKTSGVDEHLIAALRATNIAKDRNVNGSPSTNVKGSRANPPRTPVVPNKPQQGDMAVVPSSSSTAPSTARVPIASPASGSCTPQVPRRSPSVTDGPPNDALDSSSTGEPLMKDQIDDLSGIFEFDIVEDKSVVQDKFAKMSGDERAFLVAFTDIKNSGRNVARIVRLLDATVVLKPSLVRIMSAVAENYRQETRAAQELEDETGDVIDKEEIREILEKKLDDLLGYVFPSIEDCRTEIYHIHEIDEKIAFPMPASVSLPDAQQSDDEDDEVFGLEAIDGFEDGRTALGNACVLSKDTNRLDYDDLMHELRYLDMESKKYRAKRIKELEEKSGPKKKPLKKRSVWEAKAYLDEKNKHKTKHTIPKDGNHVPNFDADAPLMLPSQSEEASPVPIGPATHPVLREPEEPLLCLPAEPYWRYCAFCFQEQPFSNKQKPFSSKEEYDEHVDRHHVLCEVPGCMFHSPPEFMQGHALVHHFEDQKPDKKQIEEDVTAWKASRYRVHPSVKQKLDDQGVPQVPIGNYEKIMRKVKVRRINFVVGGGVFGGDDDRLVRGGTEEELLPGGSAEPPQPASGNLAAISAGPLLSGSIRPKGHELDPQMRLYKAMQIREDGESEKSVGKKEKYKELPDDRFLKGTENWTEYDFDQWEAAQLRDFDIQCMLAKFEDKILCKEGFQRVKYGPRVDMIAPDAPDGMWWKKKRMRRKRLNQITFGSGKMKPEDLRDGSQQPWNRKDGIERKIDEDLRNNPDQPDNKPACDDSSSVCSSSGWLKPKARPRKNRIIADEDEIHKKERYGIDSDGESCDILPDELDELEENPQPDIPMPEPPSGSSEVVLHASFHELEQLECKFVTEQIAATKYWTADLKDFRFQKGGKIYLVLETDTDGVIKVYYRNKKEPTQVGIEKINPEPSIEENEKKWTSDQEAAQKARVTKLKTNFT